jgi:phage recombination protein Bet
METEKKDNRITVDDFLNKPAIYESNGQEVKLTAGAVKTYLTRGNEIVTNEEVVMFMNLCKYQSLNPFLNEAYIIKFKGAPATIVVSKEAYLKRAFSIPAFDGIRAGLIIQRGNEVLEVEGAFSLKSDLVLGAWATVFVKEKKHPFVVKISIAEYDRNQSTWKTMPCTMIRKVAMVHALREAFPTDLGALYIEEEASAVSASNVIETVKADVKKETASVQPPKVEEEPHDTPPEGQTNLFVDEPGF